MQEGILNEPVREAAQRLIEVFGDQMGLKFTHLIFVMVADDGTFRSANFSENGPLTRDAVKMIAKHLDGWADSFGD